MNESMDILVINVITGKNKRKLIMCGLIDTTEFCLKLLKFKQFMKFYLVLFHTIVRYSKKYLEKIAKLVFIPNLWPKAIILGKGTF